MGEYHEVEGAGQVRVGTKVELRSGGVAWGWGEVTTLLPAGQVEVRRLDEDDAYVAAVEGDGEEVYVDDWSPDVRRLMEEWWRRHTEPAAVDHYDLKGFGRIRVGTKLEVWDGTGDDEGRDWGEVTKLLADRRVELLCYADGDRFISEIDDCSDLFVNDWSGEVYDILRSRAKAAGHGQV